MTVDLWDEIGSKEVNLVRSTTATPAISSTIHESYNNLETMPFRTNIAPYPSSHPGQLPMYGQPQNALQQQYGGSQYGQGQSVLDFVSADGTFHLHTDCFQWQTTRQLLMDTDSLNMATRANFPRCIGLPRCTRQVPWVDRRECLCQAPRVVLSKGCSPGTS